jgi:hypothetical protein
MMADKMRQSKTLFTYDLMLFDRAKTRCIQSETKTDPEYTYASLLSVLQRHIYDLREKKAGSAMTTAVAKLKNVDGDNHALAAEGTAQKRNKSRKSKKDKRDAAPASASTGAVVPPTVIFHQIPPPGGSFPTNPIPALAADKKSAGSVTWCWHFNNNNKGGKACRFSTEDCRYDHRLVSDAEFKAIEPPRARTSSPAPKGGGKATGKGKGKKTGKDGKRPASPAPPTGKTDPANYKKPGAHRVQKGQKLPYFCLEFLKTGNHQCKQTKELGRCPYHHWNKDKVEAEKKVLNSS